MCEVDEEVDMETLVVPDRVDFPLADEDDETDLEIDADPDREDIDENDALFDVDGDVL